MIYIRYKRGIRLGNWLFQYAAARSVDEDVAFYFPKEEYAEIPPSFAIMSEMCATPPLRIVQDVPPSILVFHERYKGASDPIPSTRPLLLNGYFQHYALLNEPLVRKALACPPRVKARLEEKYPFLFDGTPTVGISVRRGDYLTFLTSTSLHWVGTKYLRGAVKKFSTEFLFVVCSDDIPWCKEFFTEKRFPGRKFVFISGEDVLTQLYAHTFCTHNILSNSTFSWWGAYLNSNPQKRLIFPSRWFSVFVIGSDKGYYLKNCEIVKCSPCPSIYFWRPLITIIYIYFAVCNRLRALRYRLKGLKY